MHPSKATARSLEIKSALHFLNIQTKAFLGPTLGDRRDSVGMRAARAAGVIVDPDGKLRCPSVGTTTAYEFTNMQMTNCLLQPPPHAQDQQVVQTSKVRTVSQQAKRQKPATYAWKGGQDPTRAFAKFPRASWKEEAPGFHQLTAGSGNIQDDFELWDHVKRRWHSDAALDRESEPDLSLIADSMRESPAVMETMRREAMDLDRASHGTRKLVDAIDGGYSMGKDSYRVQRIPEKMHIEPGNELSLALATVGFSPDDVEKFEGHHEGPGGKKAWFRFPSDTPGVIFDDSHKPDRRDAYHQGPLEGATRGRFRVAGVSRAGKGKAKRDVYDLEYVGKLADSREAVPYEPTRSELLGVMDVKARQRVKATRNAARAQISAAGRNVGYRSSKDQDLPLRPGSADHIKAAAARHRTLFGNKDTDNLASALISNEEIARLGPFERAGRARDRNVAMRHLATSSTAQKLASLIEGPESPEIRVANDPNRSRYYQAVQKVIEGWNLGGDNNETRAAMRAAVTDLFDLEPIRTKQADPAEEKPKTRDEGLDAIALAMYQATQEGLGSKGNLVRLYRGLNWDKEAADPTAVPPDWITKSETGAASEADLPERKDYGSFGESLLKGGVNARVPTQPLSSFTTNLEEAVGGAFRKSDSAGTLVETTVPSEHIFSTPSTGLGNPSKDEVTVLGGDYPSRVVSRNLLRGRGI